MKHLSRAIAVATFVFVPVQTSQGQTQVFRDWAGSGSNLWSLSTNWTPAGVPNNNATFSFGVIIDGGNGLCFLDMNATIDKVGIGETSRLDILNGRTLTVLADPNPDDKDSPTGLVSVLNQVTLNSSGSSTRLRVTGEGQLTAGNIFDLPCSIEMSDNLNNRITGTAAVSQVFAIDHTCTVRGAGRVGDNLVAIHNLGTIEASLPAGMILNAGDGNVVTNEGLIAAINGATLDVEDSTLLNDGGVIHAGDGSVVTMRDSTTFRDGILSTDGTGRIRDITTSGSSRLVDVTIDGVFEVQNQGQTRLVGTITNLGTLSVLGTGSTTELQCDGPVVLGGGGTVLLSDQTQNQLEGRGTSPSLTNLDNTIMGTGSVGNGSLAIVNHAVVAANQSAGMTIDTNDSGFVNAGTIRAENGATLEILNTDVDNTGGVIEALDGSLIALSQQPVSVTNGTLRTTGSGRFQSQTTSGVVVLTDVTNEGTFEVRNQAAVRLEGAIHNSGTISLLSTGSLTQLLIDDVVDAITLTGGGTIDLGDEPSNEISGTEGAMLVNGDNTIRGSGLISDGDISVVNRGTVVADASNEMRIDTPDGGLFDNQGTLHAAGLGGLRIDRGGFQTSGQVLIDDGSRILRPHQVESDWLQTDGSTTVNGTLELDPSNSVLLQGGTLAGSGLVIGNVLCDGGAVTPGTSAGTLSVDGDFEQTSSGTLHVELGGTIAGDEHDQLSVVGDVTLGGELIISLIGEYEPGPEDEFVIMTAASISGSFSVRQFPVDGQRLATLILPGEIRLVPTCEADWNRNASIDTSDFIAYLNDYNTAQGGGNPTFGDPDIAAPFGTLNTADFLAYLNLYNAGCP